MNKMKLPICLLALTHSVGLGGAQLHMADLLQRFSPAEIKVERVVVPDVGPFSQFLDQRGFPVTILPLPIMSQLSSPKALIREIVKWPGFTRRFEALLQEVKPDIVYTNSHRSAIVIEPILTQYYIPLVWTMSEFIKSQPWHRLATYRITRRESTIVAISNFARAAILRLGAKSERVHTIPIGIEPGDFDLPNVQVAQFRQELSIAPESVLIGMVGWIQPLKGWHVLVEAIPLVRAVFPEIRFLFVGSCLDDTFKNYQDQLKVRLVELGQADSVIWLGYRQDIPVIMNACEIVLQASVEPETLGVTILEAMAARKPVICTDLGALPEVNLHGKTGLVIAPNQPLELAEAIKRLLGDAALRTRMGAQGRTRVEEGYARQHQMQAHVKLFQELSQTP